MKREEIEEKISKVLAQNYTISKGFNFIDSPTKLTDLFIELSNESIEPLTKEDRIEDQKKWYRCGFNDATSSITNKLDDKLKEINKQYLEKRLSHYYELRQIGYEGKVSTYVIDQIISELERALTYLNSL